MGIESIDYGFRSIEKPRINGLTYECCGCKTQEDVLIAGAYETIHKYCTTCNGSVKEWKRMLPHSTIRVDEMSVYHRMNIIRALGIPEKTEDEFIKQKECSTCLNPILPDQKTHIDKSGVERHKTCAIGFHK